MEEDQIRHLELIQNVITRQGQNSFVYKGWAVTVTAAIFALAATRDLAPEYLLVALLPTLAFWGLDALYLRGERLFREHYQAMQKLSHEDWKENAFSMSVVPYQCRVSSWTRVCFSRTIAGLYIPIILIVLAVTFLVWKGVTPT